MVLPSLSLASFFCSGSLFFSFIVVDDTQLMQNQMNMQMGAAGQDTQKIFQSEKENLELVRHTWELEDIEKRALGIQRKQPTSLSFAPSPSPPAAEADTSSPSSLGKTESRKGKSHHH